MVEERCERCGELKDEHVRIIVKETWNAAGMGFVKTFDYICPTAFFKLQTKKRGL